MAGVRKTLQGTVISTRMQKTVVVAVYRKKRHRLYKKTINVTKHYPAHDENNDCRLGDVVVLEETRPVSKTKRWRVSQVLVRGDVADVAPSIIGREIEEAVSAPAESEADEAASTSMGAAVLAADAVTEDSPVLEAAPEPLAEEAAPEAAAAPVAEEPVVDLLAPVAVEEEAVPNADAVEAAEVLEAEESIPVEAVGEPVAESEPEAATDTVEAIPDAAEAVLEPSEEGDSQVLAEIVPEGETEAEAAESEDEEARE